MLKICLQGCPTLEHLLILWGRVKLNRAIKDFSSYSKIFIMAV